MFVFHYEPRPDVIEAQAKRIYRNAVDLSFERAPITIEKDGVSLERERYTDPRVQTVFDRECSARLMQSILRLRQMMNPDKIAVVFTSEPIGGLPIAPIPFTLKDVERCFGGGGNWDELEAFLTETDVEKVAERDGRIAKHGVSENRREPEVEQSGNETTGVSSLFKWDFA